VSDDTAAKLRRVPMFKGCSTDDLEELANRITSLSVDASAEIVHEGTTDTSRFFVIATGHAEVSKRFRKVAELGPGDFFGELALLVDRPRNCTVTATTPMEVLVLDRRSFTDALNDMPSLGAAVAAALADRLCALEDTLI
jgi:CRP-like cAMP-binding protein